MVIRKISKAYEVDSAHFCVGSTFLCNNQAFNKNIFTEFMKNMLTITLRYSLYS